MITWDSTVKNGEGYNDSTACEAILRADLIAHRKEMAINHFMDDLYFLCEKHGVKIDGEISVRFTHGQKIYKKALKKPKKQ